MNASTNTMGVGDEPAIDERQKLAVETFAIVSHYFTPSRFSQPLVLYRLLRHLPADRYGLLSITPYDRNTPTNDQDGPWLDAPYFHIDSGFPWRQVSQTSGAAGILRDVYTLANLTVALYRRARCIETVIKERNYKAIVGCSGDPIDLPASAIAARRLGVRFIAYMFDDYGTQYKMISAYQHLTSRLDGFVARRAQPVIVPNEMLATDYDVRHGVQPIIIRGPHGGVYGEGVDWPLATGKLRIVYTGAVYHVHDDAFARLLQVIDDSDERFSLELYSSVDTTRYPIFKGQRYVRHHGHVTDSEAVRLQQKADILFLPLAFVCPTPDVVRSALPGKFSEYLASGRPILAHVPPDSFIAQYCRQYQCAALVDQPDPRALAETLQRIVTDSAFRRSIVRAALRRAHEDFDPMVSAKKFLSVVRGQSG